jgi:hypothetical protein
MRIKRIDDGYRLSTTYKRGTVYFFITIMDSIKLFNRFEKDFEEAAKECEIEMSKQCLKK